MQDFVPATKYELIRRPLPVRACVTVCQMNINTYQTLIKSITPRNEHQITPNCHALDSS